MREIQEGGAKGQRYLHAIVGILKLTKKQEKL